MENAGSLVQLVILLDSFDAVYWYSCNKKGACKHDCNLWAILADIFVENADSYGENMLFLECIFIVHLELFEILL